VTPLARLEFRLARLDHRLAQIERFFAVTLYGLLAVAVVGTIITRDVFGVTFSTLLESAPVLVLWLTLVGASLALAEHRHIRLEAVVRYCPSLMRRWAFRLTSLFGAGICTLLGIAGINFVGSEMAIFGAKGILATVFPAFFFLAAFRFIVRAVGTVVPQSEMSHDSGEMP